MLELKVPPLGVCALFAVAIVGLALAFPGANAAFPGHRAVAVAAVMLGVGVGGAGVIQFLRAKTTLTPLAPAKASSIVASGIFGISRNPMYLGMAVGLFGLAAWWSTLPGYALLPLFCAYLTAFQIKPEERAMQARFGDEFLAYTARVRRWI